MLKLALLVPLLLAAPLALASEHPNHGACDSTGRLVCGGADAFGGAECTLQGLVGSCTWTRSFLWEAYSPVALPGQSVVNGSARVQVCVGNSCATTTYVDAPETCSWVGPLSCAGGTRHDGAEGPVALALGQCLRVEVTQRVDIEATVVQGVATLAKSSWTETRSGAGQVCPVDDGR